jgi:hypothetical protein
MYLVADFCAGEVHPLARGRLVSVHCRHPAERGIWCVGCVCERWGPTEKVNFVTEDLGADGAWNYNEVDWAEKVMEATKGKGGRYHCRFRGGRAIFQRNLESVALDGQVVIMGLLSGSVVPPGLDISALVRRRVRV